MCSQKDLDYFRKVTQMETAAVWILFAEVVTVERSN